MLFTFHMKGQMIRASEFLNGPLHCTTLALIQTEIENCAPLSEPANILQKRSHDKEFLQRAFGI